MHNNPTCHAKPLRQVGALCFALVTGACVCACANPAALSPSDISHSVRAPAANIPAFKSKLADPEPNPANRIVEFQGKTYEVLTPKSDRILDTPTAPILLLKDTVSNEIRAFRMGLRLRLQPGQNYADFLAAQPTLLQKEITAESADVWADPRYVISTYKTLLKDPKVAHVEFLPPAAPPQHPK